MDANGIGGNVGPNPTQFEELNQVLRDLTGHAREILGSNFVGAYLQGSFAVGDADIHSDCDFLIPVCEQITSRQVADLRALHDEIPTRPGHWTKHLEGSYPVLEELRSLRGLGAPWLYVDHGWREMQWSTHCNSEVARWSLRERGVTVSGPNPKQLLDRVPAKALRDRMRDQIPTALDDVLSWISLDIAWAQRYVVTTLCRMLYTLKRGEVASKKGALQWAKDTMPPDWQPLLEHVLVDRVRDFDPQDPPRPGSVERTLSFVRYAEHMSRRWSEAELGGGSRR
jgi:hypothetical protein